MAFGNTNETLRKGKKVLSDVRPVEQKALRRKAEPTFPAIKKRKPQPEGDKRFLEGVGTVGELRQAFKNKGRDRLEFTDQMIFAALRRQKEKCDCVGCLTRLGRMPGENRVNFQGHHILPIKDAFDFCMHLIDFRRIAPTLAIDITFQVLSDEANLRLLCTRCHQRVGNETKHAEVLEHIMTRAFSTHIQNMIPIEAVAAMNNAAVWGGGWS